MDLTPRQKKLLKLTIEKYIESNIAISSLNLKKHNHFDKISSATIRNEMVVLEDLDYLKKEFSSSGRIPTKKGYQVYIESLMSDWKIKDKTITNKLTEIFSDRNESIDITLDKSIGLISEFLNLPVIVTQVNKPENELLKKIDITQISQNDYLIFVVTSLSQIYKSEILINDFHEKSDLDICVRLMNEKLIDTPLSLIEEKIQEIIPELRRRIHKFEFIYASIISKILSQVLSNTKTRVYNSKSIISQPEVKNNSIDVYEIFNLLENYSTLSQLKFNYLKTGNTLIHLDSNISGLSLATTVVDSENQTHKLTVVGPNRMNYSLIKYFLEFINEKLINNK